MPNPPEPFLKVEGLYWHCADRVILDNISFDIEEGSFVGLIGPNGSGKSSLMRCCYRINKPGKGRILLCGEDIWKRGLKDNAKQVAVILQEHQDHLGLTVKEVVRQGLVPHKSFFEWDSAEDARFVDRVIEDLDLRLIKESLFSQLSGGEKQRVMLARAVVQRPKLLIMDEPTNHLDVHYQIDLLNKVKDMGVTVLASFHDLNLASAYCTRLLVLNNGRLVADGTCEEVLTESLVSDVFNAQVLIDKHPRAQVPRVSYVY